MGSIRKSKENPKKEKNKQIKCHSYYLDIKIVWWVENMNPHFGSKIMKIIRNWFHRNKVALKIDVQWKTAIRINQFFLST